VPFLYAGGAALAIVMRTTRRLILPTKLVATGSTNPVNFVKIGPVDVEIIGFTEITEIFLNGKTTAKHKPSSPALSGWANNCSATQYIG